jgi:hypothetical protein
MTTNYANQKLTKAIENHLLNLDLIPPTDEVSKLAGDLAQLCLGELNTAGLGHEAVEKLFRPLSFKAGAPGAV